MTYPLAVISNRHGLFVSFHAPTYFSVKIQLKPQSLHLLIFKVYFINIQSVFYVNTQCILCKYRVYMM